MFTVHSPTQNAEDGDMDDGDGDDGDGDDGDGDDGDRDDYGAPLRSIAFILHAVSSPRRYRSIAAKTSCRLQCSQSFLGQRPVAREQL